MTYPASVIAALSATNKLRRDALHDRWALCAEVQRCGGAEQHEEEKDGVVQN